METECRPRAYVKKMEIYPLCKRMLDVLLALLGLGVMLLPMVVLGAALYWDDPGPVLFYQTRLGRHGQPFTLYKLRTMKVSAPRSVATWALREPERYITRMGRFLRRTSLDEVPQLINILKGDMSLVGPRPLIPEEQDIHRMRLAGGVYALRPGITGLAQINGRDLVSPERKARLDETYLHQLCFLTDLRILLRTVRKVFYCEDVLESAGFDPSGRYRMEEQEVNL